MNWYQAVLLRKLLYLTAAKTLAPAASACFFASALFIVRVPVNTMLFPLREAMYWLEISFNKGRSGDQVIQQESRKQRSRDWIFDRTVVLFLAFDMCLWWLPQLNFVLAFRFVSVMVVVVRFILRCNEESSKASSFACIVSFVNMTHRKGGGKYLGLLLLCFILLFAYVSATTCAFGSDASNFLTQPQPVCLPKNFKNQWVIWWKRSNSLRPLLPFLHAISTRARLAVNLNMPN